MTPSSVEGSAEVHARADAVGLDGALRSPMLVLVAGGLAGLALVVGSVLLLLASMRLPLEHELSRRAQALCREAARELEYAATVEDARAAERTLALVAKTTSADVAAASLVEPTGLELATWDASPPRDDVGELPLRDIGELAALVGAPQRHAPAALEIACPVRAVDAAEDMPLGDPAAGEAAQGGAPAAYLRLLVGTAEVDRTVRDTLVGAVPPIGLTVTLAVALQATIAVYVIERLRRSLAAVQQLQQHLIRADKLAAVGSLAAGIAHEINNPLAYVAANLEYVARELRGASPDVVDALADAREGAGRVRAIVRDMKSLSRANDGPLEPVDLQRVLRAAAKIAASEVRQRALLVWQLDQDVGHVLGDEGRLVQVFVNLLVNAAHAIPEGLASENEIRIVAALEGDHARVDVVDTGVGIPPENIGKVFDAFFTTKSQGVGTGLGLAVCHGIVSSLGGDLAVESEVGKGSTFRVRVPRAPAAALEPDAPPPQPFVATHAARRARVLVVDDERQVAEGIRRLLAADHDVVTATSARDALAVLDGSAPFDLLLCDVMMPEMTGIELHAELERSRPDDARAVVFLTGGAFTAAGREALRATSVPILEKPFTRATLEALIRTMPDRGAPRAA